MNSRGRHASLPKAGHSRPEYLVAGERGGLIVSGQVVCTWFGIV